MITDYDLDLLLESTMASRGPQVAPASLGDVVMDGIRGASQRRPWIRGLDRRAWPAPRHSIADPAFARAGRIALVVALAIALIAASAAMGSWLLETDHRPQLVFGSAAGGLYVADHDGSNTRQIAADGMYVEPRFSPDGRWIAADYIPAASARPVGGSTTDRRSVVVLRSDGTDVFDVPSTNPVWAFTWGAAGPSAGWLAISFGESLVVLDPASGSRVTIDTAGENVRALAWSPDEPRLWWVVSHPGPGVFGRGIEAADVHSVRLDQEGGSLRIAAERSFVLDLDPERTVRGLEAMAVSPDSRTLAFRARTEGWLRSDLVVVDAAGGDATFVTPPPPGEPWISAWSGIRWTSDGTGVVVEVGEMVGSDTAIVQPAILPLDGSAPRPIEAGSFTGDGWGGVVTGGGPVLATDPTILVGGARSYLDVAGGQISYYDIWLADANGEGSRLIATGTLGGDVR